MNTAVIYVLLMLAANNHLTVQEFAPTSNTQQAVKQAFTRCMQAIPDKVSQPNPDQELLLILGHNNRIIVREYPWAEKDTCTTDRSSVMDEAASPERNQWVFAACAPKSQSSPHLVFAKCVTKPLNDRFHFQ